MTTRTFQFMSAARIRALVSAIGVFTLAPSLFAAATINDLGTLGGNGSIGFAINAAGEIAGYSYTTGDTGPHAFLYTGAPGRAGSMADLASLGGNASYGFAINTKGQVAGWSATSGESHAFLYSGKPGSDGVMTDLGDLSGNGSLGAAVNDFGQVCGSAFVGGAMHAFLYSGTPGSGGSMVDLGTLPNGFQSSAAAINDAGQITGASDTGEFISLVGAVSHAFLYTGTPGNSGSMVDLGSLGGRQSQGTAINAAGQVVGSSYITGDTAFHAFLYTGTPGKGGAMADLGMLEGNESYGLGINAAGQVVGYSFTADGAEHAFIYIGKPRLNGKMIDLDAWLDANNPTEGAKWTLVQAAGITDTGLITGYGFYNDGSGAPGYATHAFLLDASVLTAPEPPSCIILATGAFCLFAARIRNRRTT